MSSRIYLAGSVVCARLAEVAAVHTVPYATAGGRGGAGPQ